MKCAAFCALFLTPVLSLGATSATTNFVVTAPTEEMARKIASCAEFWRKDLAVQWLGKPLPNWYKPCPISVKVGQIGAGGQTTFTFENGEVFGWRMSVQGSLERILDSVIPHEVNHTIFASYFRRPLPRWADEGAATLFEHDSEQARQTRLLNEVLNTSRRIPLQQLLTIREYPEDMRDVLTLYAEGYSLADYLVGIKGERGRSIYLRFLQDAHTHGWSKAITENYGFNGIEDLEHHWTQWILAGSPESQQPAGEMLAHVETEPAQMAAAEDVVIRSQSPHQDQLPVQMSSETRPEPLRQIPRDLRSNSSDGERQSASVLRTAEHGGDSDPLSQPDREFRLRSGERPHSDPSLPSPTLSPTADGVHTDPDGHSYRFPQARR